MGVCPLLLWSWHQKSDLRRTYIWSPPPFGHTFWISRMTNHKLESWGCEVVNPHTYQINDPMVHWRSIVAVGMEVDGDMAGTLWADTWDNHSTNTPDWFHINCSWEVCAQVLCGAPGSFPARFHTLLMRNISRSILRRSWFISVLLSHALHNDYKQKKSSAELLVYFLPDFTHF